MPIAFTNLSGLSPAFISSTGTCASTTSGNAVELVYSTTPFSSTTAGAPPATSIYNTIDLCVLSKALMADAYTNVATNANTNFTNIAATINQLIDFLRCTGPDTCTLTGPSQCCPNLPNNGAAKISIKLPSALSFPSVSFGTNGSIVVGGSSFSNTVVSPLF